MASLTLHQVLQNVYGVKTYRSINPQTATVQTSATLILKGNPNRLSFTVVNLGTNPIYLGPENDVSATKGIYLVSNGGFLSLSFETDFELCSDPWYAIAVGGTSTVYVIANNVLGGQG